MLMNDAISLWIKENQLVKVTFMKSKAGRHNVYGKILRYDSEMQLLLLYDVDHKITHHLKWNEIDEIVSV